MCLCLPCGTFLGFQALSLALFIAIWFLINPSLGFEEFWRSPSPVPFIGGVWLGLVSYSFFRLGQCVKCVRDCCVFFCKDGGRVETGFTRMPPSASNPRMPATEAEAQA